MLFISPPFGNYLNLPRTKSIKGSFTLEKRDGLLMQIIRTLRYSFVKKGWINKIGLRNKGIDWAVDKYKNGYFNFYRNSVISIAIMDESEIDKFLEKIPEKMDLEVNVSCPNIEHSLVCQNIHKFLSPKREWCSIKLAPNTNMELIDMYYKQGFRKFHCSNTLPVEGGGLSGISLIPYTSDLIREIKKEYPDVEIIAGGGIRNMSILKNYKDLGADHFSISTLLFNPFLFSKFYIKFIRSTFHIEKL